MAPHRSGGGVPTSQLPSNGKCELIARRHFVARVLIFAQGSNQARSMRYRRL
jgi:hypothetical protein